jgi:endo-1,4-beta-mannosidase
MAPPTGGRQRSGPTWTTSSGSSKPGACWWSWTCPHTGTGCCSAGQFPYDAAAWNAYLDFVGRHYQNEAAIAYYAIAGEVPPPDESVDKRATAEQIVAFYRATTKRLRAADHSHHLVASGGLNHLEPPTTIPWQTVFALPGVDLATVHLYSAGDQNVVLPAVARWSDQASKPLVIEEFGFRQMMGDQARAAAFAGMFGLVERYAAQGAIFWNLGPELAPSSYEVGSQTPGALDTVRKFARLLARPAPTP